jgi:hypothetical protein
MNRTYFWIGIAAAAIVAATLLLLPAPKPPAPDPVETWKAKNPWLIGTSGDAYDYAGEAAHILDHGTVTLQIDPSTAQRSLDISLPAEDGLVHWFDGVQSGSSIVLRQTLGPSDPGWNDLRIHGATGIGDPQLPETHATVAGSGILLVYVDGTEQPTQWRAFWSVADALRQSDGAIRNQGLVFSPLLRDRSGFSDPTRLELSVLLYPAATPGSLAFQLIFPSPELQDPAQP